MKLSNFKLVSGCDLSHCVGTFVATVDVTTGFLFWKKTVRREIQRTLAGDSWHFADTGEFTPEFQAERLARAWTAKTGQRT